jgi:hypothetical protein
MRRRKKIRTFEQGATFVALSLFLRQGLKGSRRKSMRLTVRSGAATRHEVVVRLRDLV